MGERGKKKMPLFLKRRERALLHAARDGHTDTVNVLLSKRADIRAKDKDDMTTLRLAAKKGHTDAVAENQYGG